MNSNINEQGCGKWFVAWIDPARKHVGMGAICGEGASRCAECIKRAGEVGQMPVKDGPECPGCGLPNYEGLCPHCRGDQDAYEEELVPPFPSSK